MDNNIVFLPEREGRTKPLPKRIAYPADYGLANAAANLIWQYGRDMAANRLIEMAERIAEGRAPDDGLFACRRVDPTQRIINAKN